MEDAAFPHLGESSQPVPRACPPRCSCPQPDTVDCSGLDLQVFPDNIARAAQHLSLQVGPGWGLSGMGVRCPCAAVESQSGMWVSALMGTGLDERVGICVPEARGGADTGTGVGGDFGVLGVIVLVVARLFGVRVVGVRGRWGVGHQCVFGDGVGFGCGCAGDLGSSAGVMGCRSLLRLLGVENQGLGSHMEGSGPSGQGCECLPACPPTSPAEQPAPGAPLQ